MGRTINNSIMGKIRVVRGMTQIELGYLMGKSVNWVNKVEGGKIWAEVEDRERVARFLKVKRITKLFKASGLVKEAKEGRYRLQRKVAWRKGKGLVDGKRVDEYMNKKGDRKMNDIMIHDLNSELFKAIKRFKYENDVSMKVVATQAIMEYLGRFEGFEYVADIELGRDGIRVSRKVEEERSYQVRENRHEKSVERKIEKNEKEWEGGKKEKTKDKVEEAPKNMAVSFEPVSFKDFQYELSPSQVVTRGSFQDEEEREEYSLWAKEVAWKEAEEKRVLAVKEFRKRESEKAEESLPQSERPKRREGRSKEEIEEQAEELVKRDVEEATAFERGLKG